MCPFCITTAVLSAASSGAGAIAVAASKWRTLQRWFCSGWLGSTLRLERPSSQCFAGPARADSRCFDQIVEGRLFDERV
jgi:hypothetical protein